MGRHAKSNGRISDPTYDYPRFNPQIPCSPYGRAKTNPKMTHEDWKEVCRKNPTAMNGAMIPE